MADEKAQEIVSRYDGIVDSEFTSWSLDKCTEYCLEINKVKMSPTTYNDYQCALNKHIKPYFKNGKPLKDIRAKDIETFLTAAKNTQRAGAFDSGSICFVFLLSCNSSKQINKLLLNSV